MQFISCDGACGAYLWCSYVRFKARTHAITNTGQKRKRAVIQIGHYASSRTMTILSANNARQQLSRQKAINCNVICADLAWIDG